MRELGRRIVGGAVVVLVATAWPVLAQETEGEHPPGHGRHQGTGEAEQEDHGDHHGKGMRHDFSDVERYVERFESPERLKWQKPEHVVELMEIEAGMTVVDLGSGTGFFVPYLAEAVGPDGRVLALDVEGAMVEHLRERVAKEGWESVEPRRVPYDDPELEEGSVDRILIVNTWHHIDDRSLYAAKLREALAPGGRVYVVDFVEESPHGPPARHRLEAGEVAEELEGGGLEARTVEEELPYQYIVVGTPSGELEK